MTRRWKWDFEDERAVPGAPAPPATPPPARPAPGPQLRRRIGGVQVRRRGGAAALLLVILVAVLAAALTGSGPHARKPAASAASAPARAGGAVPPPARNPEAEAGAAVKRVLSFTPFVRAGGGHAKEIALTFDDGPGPYTPEVLDVLERLHVHATFF